MASVRLQQGGVSLLPGRVKRWRGEHEIQVPYATIIGLSMTEPGGRLAQGRLVLRLEADEAEHSVSFRGVQVRDMRRIQAEIWRRAAAARAGAPEPTA